MRDVTRITSAISSVVSRQVVSLPFEIVGLVVVPLAGMYRKKPLSEVPSVFLPWANPEDWTGGYLDHRPEDNCVPNNLRDRYRGWFGFYRYHALRNRAHGLRNFSWFTLKLDQDSIGFKTNIYMPFYAHWWIQQYIPTKIFSGASFWFLAWQNQHVGYTYLRYFKIFGKMYWFRSKAGWRIGPRDKREGFDPRSTRWVHGSSVAFSLLKFGRA